MIADFDTEYARAHDRAAFSNGFEGESWMAGNCETCAVDATDGGCVLLSVAYLGRTPAQWQEGQWNSLTQRYVCPERVDAW